MECVDVNMDPISVRIAASRGAGSDVTLGSCCSIFFNPSLVQITGQLGVTLGS